jgi:hypothetical protein
MPDKERARTLGVGVCQKARALGALTSMIRRTGGFLQENSLGIAFFVYGLAVLIAFRGLQIYIFVAYMTPMPGGLGSFAFGWHRCSCNRQIQRWGGGLRIDPPNLAQGKRNEVRQDAPRDSSRFSFKNEKSNLVAMSRSISKVKIPTSGKTGQKWGTQERQLGRVREARAQVQTGRGMSHWASVPKRVTVTGI